MNVKIFNSEDSIEALNEKIFQWTLDNKPKIFKTNLVVNSFSFQNQFMTEYVLAIMYELTEEQEKKVDMVYSLTSKATENDN